MNIHHFIDQGGEIVMILLVMMALGAVLMLWKVLVLSSVRLRVKKITRQHSQNIPLYGDYSLVELYVQEQMKPLERGLSTIKIIATISPLLGLLGTVIGIYSAFVSISAHGLGDPSYFAGDISMAMVTTIAGLIVAIPHYIGYNYLISMLDKLELIFVKELYAELKSNNA